MKVTVLRIGHRYVRDYRVTTHVALVARAFGADGMFVTDAENEIRKTLQEVNERFGGEFQVEEVHSWKNVIKQWKDAGNKVVHLTMYGMPVDDIMPEIRNQKHDIMVVVGAEKVPKEVYDLSDYNVAIGNQPHSEVAALAIFLDRLSAGKTLKRDFNGRIRIVPSAKGKDVKVRDK